MSEKPTAEEVKRVVIYLADLAGDVAWQAGVGGIETAGSFVSFLAANPDRIEAFLGDFVDAAPANGFHAEGCLSWHGADGKIHWALKGHGPRRAPVKVAQPNYAALGIDDPEGRN